MSHEAPSLDENQDDPVIGWTCFVAVVGILLLLVGVYFAHGIYYQTARGDRLVKESRGAGALLEATIAVQERRLDRHDSWQAVDGQKEVPKVDGNGAPKLDENGAPLMTQESTFRAISTISLEEARAEVLAALKATQGR